jgi:hypothetical protein
MWMVAREEYLEGFSRRTVTSEVWKKDLESRISKVVLETHRWINISEPIKGEKEGKGEK